PLQRRGNLPPPGVEVVSAAFQDDRRDPRPSGALHPLDEPQRVPVVGLALLAAGDEQRGVGGGPPPEAPPQIRPVLARLVPLEEIARRGVEGRLVVRRQSGP